MSLVVFRLRIRPRWLPYLPALSDLVEVNLRTYVRFGDAAGIWFLSVHADNAWAIAVARLLTPMPYVRAPMRYERRGDRFHFRAGGSLSRRPRLSLAYRPGSREDTVGEGTLDAWLLERYRLYVRGRGLQQAEVVHSPWSIRGAEVSLRANTLGDPFGLDLGRAPERVHWSAGVAASFGRFRAIGNSGESRTTREVAQWTYRSSYGVT